MYLTNILSRLKVKDNPDYRFARNNSATLMGKDTKT